MKYYNFFLIILVFTSFACQIKNPLTQIDVSAFKWSLSSIDTSVVIHDVSPANVHLALFKAGIIPDPFYRDHEKALQWIGQHDWKLETSFDLDESFLNHENIELIFEGLDTYAEVVLNDSLVLSADNMFRSWHVDVHGLLKSTHNKLTIYVRSPIEKNKAKKENLSYTLPDDRGFTRKAAYHFGWDWGPTFVTSGIWKPSYLHAWDGTIIRDVYARVTEIEDDIARMMLEMEIEATAGKKYSIRVFINDTMNSEVVSFFNKGISHQNIPIEIADPKLWWPNGYGAQNRCKISVKILDESGLVDEYTFKTGIRKVELVQEEDTPGNSFYFKINGVPIFAKGANYIPQDNFLPRLDDEDYRVLILDAKKSNMNMIRVWGGGIYEKDIFYDLCDELGIMVWQDFMFACNMYPGDSLFLENVKSEAIDNIRRIRNHPSLVLWCGNNEVDEAWHNWGWQKQFGYSTEDSTEIWHNYLSLFEELLPELVKKYNPEIPYWPSSPSTGWGREAAYTKGDVHYWGVWWGKEPFDKYEEKVGRFMSEYGFQGMPDPKTINAFTEPDDRRLGSEVMDVHQKHPFGWAAINDYMERDFNVPEHFDDYVYVSQLLQAKGIKTAVEAHRRAKPYCMGTLYWQLNDCWPVTSWSGIDYFGRWKAMQYMVKKAYKTFLISFEEKSEGLAIYVVSDSISDLEASLIWKLMDFNGLTLEMGEEDFTIEKNSSAMLTRIAYGPYSNSVSEMLLSAELWSQGKKLASAQHYFVKPKNLALLPANIQLAVRNENNNFSITLASETLVKAVKLRSNTDGFFSDNYFDLLPGEKKSMLFTPDQAVEQIPKFKIKCLNNIY